MASFASFAKQAAATAVGVNIGNIARNAKEMAMSWIHAAEGPAAAKRQMIAMNELLRDMPLAQATSEASALQQEFKALSLETGISGENIRGAFGVILEMGKGTTAEVERAKHQIGELAKISEALEMPVESVAREVSFLEEGMLRTRGHMFQLLNRTGIFGKDIHHAAEEWQKLTEEERMKRVAFALEQTAGRVGKLPMTWGKVTGQLNAILMGVKKDFGEPLIDAMVPEMEIMVHELAASRGEVRKFAQEMGKDVGRWVHEAAQTIEVGFQYIKTHQQEIRSAIDEGVSRAKWLVEFILAHKVELAAAWGASKVAGPILTSTASRVAAGMILGGGAPAAAASASAVASTAATGGILGGVTTVGAFVAGVGMLVAPLYLAARSIKNSATEFEKNDQIMNRHRLGGAGAAQEDFLRRVGGGAGGGRQDMAQLERMVDSYKALVAKTGGDRAAAEEVTNHAMTVARQAARQLDSFETSSRGVLEHMRILADMNVGKGSSPEAVRVAKEQAEEASRGVQAAADAAQAAINTNNTVLQQQMGTLITQTPGLVESFINAGGATADQLMALSTVVATGSSDLAKALADAAANLTKDLKGEKPKFTVHNDFRGSSITMKQDFRDQDPDRIAVVFHGLVGQAINQTIAARTSAAHGT